MFSQGHHCGRRGEILSPFRQVRGQRLFPSGPLTHRPSASSCPRHRRPRWVKRNQALTRTWWHLPRVRERWIIRTLVRQVSSAWDKGSLSSHEHTTHGPQEPATTTGGMHGDGPDHPGWGAWGFPWLMPLPPTSQTLRKAMDNQAHSTGSLAGLALKLTEGTRGVWMGRGHKLEGWRTRVTWSLQPQFQKPTQDPFPSPPVIPP